MWKGYLSHRRRAKAQTSLRFRAFSTEPSPFAHTIQGTGGNVRQRAPSLALLKWLRMRVLRITNRSVLRSIFLWHGSFQSRTRHLLIFSLRYRHTSLVALGQFVSSSSSRLRSCVSPQRPWLDNNVQPITNKEIKYNYMYILGVSIKPTYMYTVDIQYFGTILPLYGI